MTIQQRFQDFIKTEQLFLRDDRILLAVSGGLDSMVMSHLFLEIGLSFGVAHCNFKLRGADSDGDEQFLKDWASQHRVPFYVVPFETEEIAKKEKQSIQMIARTLRYEWLEKTRLEFQFDYIATAHHMNDSIETTIYNFIKGTGIKGLMGIPIKNGKIIRPLMRLDRQSLESYQQEKEIVFREDSSNQEDKYARNKIRHHVIPIFKDLNPNLEVTAKNTFDNLKDTSAIYRWAIQEIKTRICIQREEQLHIDFKELENFPAAVTVLYELLLPYGFNASQAKQIWENRNNFSGAFFHSTSHELLVDRATFILNPRKNSNNRFNEVLWLNSEMRTLYMGKSKIVAQPYLGFPSSFSEATNLAYLDANKMIFPLKIRHWQNGDYFYPLGMAGKRKKVKDFFTDLKLNRLEKREVWILENGDGAICWVIGYRVDERFKLNENTEKYWMLKFLVESMG